MLMESDSTRITYTPEFLIALRESPLVERPENMILDYVQQLSRPKTTDVAGKHPQLEEEEDEGFTRKQGNIVRKTSPAKPNNRPPQLKQPLLQNVRRAEKTPEWMDFDGNADVDFSNATDDFEQFRAQMKAQDQHQNHAPEPQEEYIPQNSRQIESMPIEAVVSEKKNVDIMPDESKFAKYFNEKANIKSARSAGHRPTNQSENLQGATAALHAMLSINSSGQTGQSPMINPPPMNQLPMMNQQMNQQQSRFAQHFERPPPHFPQQFQRPPLPNASTEVRPDMQRIMAMLARSPTSPNGPGPRSPMYSNPRPSENAISAMVNQSINAKNMNPEMRGPPGMYYARPMMQAPPGLMRPPPPGFSYPSQQRR